MQLSAEFSEACSVVVKEEVIGDKNEIEDLFSKQMYLGQKCKIVN